MMATSYSIEYIRHNHLFDGWASRSVEVNYKFAGQQSFDDRWSRAKARERRIRIHLQMPSTHFGFDCNCNGNSIRRAKWMRDDADAITTSIFSSVSIVLMLCIVHRSNYSSRASIEVSAINRLNECGLFVISLWCQPTYVTPCVRLAMNKLPPSSRREKSTRTHTRFHSWREISIGVCC